MVPHQFSRCHSILKMLERSTSTTNSFTRKLSSDSSSYVSVQDDEEIKGRWGGGGWVGKAGFSWAIFGRHRPALSPGKDFGRSKGTLEVASSFLVVCIWNEIGDNSSYKWSCYCSWDCFCYWMRLQNHGRGGLLGRLDSYKNGNTCSILAFNSDGKSSRRTGAAKAVQLGSLFTSHQALENGLVDEIVPLNRVFEKARQEVPRWLEIPDHARVAIKQDLRQSLIDRVNEVKDVEVDQNAALVMQPNIQRNIARALKRLKERKNNKPS
ncbi:putative enoyl-CoA delta isomerase 1, mitochondrial [Apostichopus japonicus]|uniref:Putative enoyl-CoA delta isomerase 1, mitochondrial n=1 Tax=Stichopus japonicus TaxID=307972 RepID=A0A2G8JG25_STIJA|nr:putative enoyl-CoA delta isomerase 1, mitochondrial [Apostichopus japonicus]